MQFRVIVVTDPPTNKHTHKQSNRQDQLQYTALLSLARSVTRMAPSAYLHRGPTVPLIQSTPIRNQTQEPRDHNPTKLLLFNKR